VLLLTSCVTNDIVNEQNEDPITAEKALKSNQALVSNKSFDNVVMDLSFEKGIINEGSGCSFEYMISPNGSTYTSTACYGPNPVDQNGYLIRGYGKPMRASAMRGNPWRGVKLEAKNKPKEIINGGHTELANSERSNAISIEFPFQANVTYEITLSTRLTDYIKVIKSPSGLGNTPIADQYDIDKSEAFPTIDLQLVETPVIPGNDPCSNTPVVPSQFLAPPNYTRKQKAEKSTEWAHEEKTFTFYFSTKENKQAMLIKFLPEISNGRNPSYVPESYFWLDIRNIKIVQKPFDASYYIAPPPPINNNPCPGFRRCP
jgi:hypothetical protein